MLDEKIDILESNLILYSKKLFNMLLEDKTTDSNIIWAINDYYEKYGYGFEPQNCITASLITGLFDKVVQPRSQKSIDIQSNRTKDRAEVFTPAWICNKQNNLIDNAWFEKDNVFNVEGEKTWITNKEKIKFEKKGKTWKDYVSLNRLEITCGEAPYLVSRYDSVTGKPIDIENRIGLLDRKLRVVCENVNTKSEWIKWSLNAIKSVYAYDYQGDNVLLARENILYTYIDFYKYFFHQVPSEKELINVTKIIIWNIWQMDGLTYKSPYISSKLNNSMDNKDSLYCIIKDWKKDKIITFKSLIDKDI